VFNLASQNVNSEQIQIRRNAF